MRLLININNKITTFIFYEKNTRITVQKNRKPDNCMV